jgi:hypothetical protein
MTTDNPAGEGSLLEQAIQAIQSGERQKGRALLAQVLSADPKEARAWLWLAACWDEADKKRYCLEKAQSLRPDDPHIQQALELLPASSGSTPVDPEDLPAQQELSPGPEQAPAPAGPEGESLPKPSTEAGVKPAAPGPKDAKRAPKPKPRQSAGVRFLRGLMLVLLSILALASIGLLVFVVLEFELPMPPTTAPQPPPSAAAGEIPVFQLPATWTPTPGTEASPSPTRPLQSTGTALPSATLPPSITPVTPSFDQWRIVIGQSVQDKSIEVFRFGLGSRERMIIAGMHGTSDGDSVSLADQMIAHLQANPRLVPEETTLYILRLLNPDAMAASGRFNANGVDLNRNFAENWKSTWEGQGCLSTEPATAGTTALSEPETQAVTKFLAARQVEVLVNYRSGGGGAYPGGQAADTESMALAQAIAGISDFSYPAEADDCEYTGLLIDWAVAKGVEAAVDLAATNPQDLDFETNLEILDLVMKWEPSNATLVPSSPTPTFSLTTTLTTTVTLSATPTLTASATITAPVTAAATPTQTVTASPSPNAP